MTEQVRNRSPRSVAESTGMSLRDWFAGQALVGIANNPQEVFKIASEQGVRPCEMAAKIAFDFADALIAAREK